MASRQEGWLYIACDKKDERGGRGEERRRLRVHGKNLFMKNYRIIRKLRI